MLVVVVTCLLCIPIVKKIHASSLAPLRIITLKEVNAISFTLFFPNFHLNAFDITCTYVYKPILKLLITKIFQPINTNFMVVKFLNLFEGCGIVIRLLQ